MLNARQSSWRQACANIVRTTWPERRQSAFEKLPVPSRKAMSEFKGLVELLWYGFGALAGPFARDDHSDLNAGTCGERSRGPSVRWSK